MRGAAAVVFPRVDWPIPSGNRLVHRFALNSAPFYSSHDEFCVASKDLLNVPEEIGGGGTRALYFLSF